jgi:hypothetical protein
VQRALQVGIRIFKGNGIASDKDQGVATMIEQGVITGYAAGIGIFGHAVAKSNEELKALIANASAILGPGFFAPARNHELINWLLENGFQIGWPANLMTIGPYQEPQTPFLPSLAYQIIYTEIMVFQICAIIEMEVEVLILVWVISF